MNITDDIEKKLSKPQKWTPEEIADARGYIKPKPETLHLPEKAKRGRPKNR